MLTVSEQWVYRDGSLAVGDWDCTPRGIAKGVEERTREHLQKAGFRSIETNQLEHDFQNNWYVVRK